MANYQYIYSMHSMQGVGKVAGGKREILKDIYLSFLPGGRIGVRQRIGVRHELLSYCGDRLLNTLNSLPYPLYFSQGNHNHN